MKFVFVPLICAMLYWIAYNDANLFLGYIIAYLFVLIIHKFFLKASKDSIILFNIFWGVYSLLVLFTHMELIKDPLVDYYFHNDASDSFYTGLVENVYPCKWTDISELTLLSPYFSHYPLSAFCMAIWGKVGIVLGVENTRLFLRLISVAVGSSIIVIMAQALTNYGIKAKIIKKNLLIFGLLSYLYIASGIFTRDIHVFLLYTIAMYLYITPKVKFRFLKFLIILIFTLGVRLENTPLIALYIFAYYYTYLKKVLGGATVMIFAILIFALVLVLKTYISDMMETLSYYDDYNSKLSSGVFSFFYHLPFPLNTFAMTIYELLTPIPFTGLFSGSGNTFFSLPFAMSPYLMAFLFMGTLWYVFKNKYKNRRVSDFILLSLVLFCAIIFGSPHIRRAFAPIPGLFVAYVIILNSIPKRINKFIIQVMCPLIFMINMFFIIFLSYR